MARVLTEALAQAASLDAGNRSMRKGGRKAWSVDDYNAAVAEFARLIPSLLVEARLRLTGNEAGIVRNPRRLAHPFATIRRAVARRSDVTDPDALAAWIKQRLKRNPPPRQALSESANLWHVIMDLDNKVKPHVDDTGALIALDNAVDVLGELFAQASMGVHRNPTLAILNPGAGARTLEVRRRKLAKKVLVIRYVHAQDGKRYEHDFAEDTDHGAVEAFVDPAGTRVILEATDGRPIVKDY